MSLRVSILLSLTALALCACNREPEAPEASSPSARPVVAIAPAKPANASAPQPAGLGSGVYVWQRVWTPGNLTALDESKSVFSELRVLAAQDQPGEGWIDAKVDLPTLKLDGRSVRPVIRIDGRLPSLDADAIAGKAHDIVAKWSEAGARVVGVEIDFDCASARLGDYAKLLAAIRAKLPAGATLSITALPSWMGSQGLATVLAQADESVLQVHAVTDPKHGLFDPKQAGEWIAAYARVGSKPFRVALPAYGSALVVDPDGQPIGVESESALPVPGERLELFADPVAVEKLVHDLQQAPPPNLRGLMWFRLPLPGDRRAWPLGTVSAVIAGKPLHADFTPAVSDGGNGAFDVSVDNSGNIEAKLPAEVDVGAAGCTDADALPGYRVDKNQGSFRFVRESTASLPATQTRPLGWIRCTHLTPADLHVHP